MIIGTNGNLIELTIFANRNIKKKVPFYCKNDAAKYTFHC